MHSKLTRAEYYKKKNLNVNLKLNRKEKQKKKAINEVSSPSPKFCSYIKGEREMGQALLWLQP